MLKILRKNKIIKLLIVIFAFSFLIFGFKVNSQGTINPLAQNNTKSSLPPVTLNWWVVWENPGDFTGLINNFKSVFPQVNINVKKFRYSEYKDALIRAWAKDEGPDIFSVPNSWMKEYEEWAEPSPEKVALKREEVSGPGCLSKRKTVSLSIDLLKPNDITQKFVSQVKDDVVSGGKVWGLPLSFDSMVLYYNRDLLDAAKIPLPPQNWEEFSDQVKKLVSVDKESNIFQAGAALGTSNNLERPVDILSLLMMQIGTKMSDVNGYANFNQALVGEKNYFPGEEALRFYTDFQDVNKEVYTWNNKMPQAIEMFSQGKLAFLFGYLYHQPTIHSSAPNLNFGVSKMPQPTGAIKDVNFANYNIQVVAKKSKNKDYAWALLKQASTKPQDYLSRSNQLTALRELIGEQAKNSNLEVFANQALTSISWYHGKNSLLMEEAFAEMIDTVDQGKATYQEAINFAVQKINRTIK
jgi:ABC-type glycerol-3-phosphate transport system substrate-binding protein